MNYRDGIMRWCEDRERRMPKVVGERLAHPPNWDDPWPSIGGDAGGGGPSGLFGEFSGSFEGIGWIGQPGFEGYADTCFIGGETTYCGPGGPYWFSAWPVSSAGGGGAGHVSQSVLANCVKTLFGVTLLAFKQSVPGGEGYFIGQGTDFLSRGGDNVPITVVNDAASYNAVGVGQLCGVSFAYGCTLPGNPYLNYTNNNNNGIGTAITQVHELGHSLFEITAGSPAIPEPNGEAGQLLQDCVKNHHGFH